MTQHLYEIDSDRQQFSEFLENSQIGELSRSAGAASTILRALKVGVGAAGSLGPNCHFSESRSASARNPLLTRCEAAFGSAFHKVADLVLAGSSSRS